MSNVKPISCAACSKTIRAPQQLKCSKCSSSFHAVCVNITDLRNLTEDLRATWICPICKSKIPKSDNSNTPVRVTAAAPSEIRATTACGAGSGTSSNRAAAACPTAVTPEPEALESLVLEIRFMREEMSDLKTHFTLLSEHVTAKLDECNAKCKQLEERDVQRELELSSLRISVTELQHRLNVKAQAELRNEIEISGLPEVRGENPFHLARTTAQIIGVNIGDSDFDFAMRVGPRTTTTAKLPRPLVVRFVRRQVRDEFLTAGKSRRTLTSADIGIAGVTTSVYFNERLTQDNRRLFRDVRQRSKDAGYKYCWVKNGTILIRRQEGAPAVVIKSLEDVVQSPSPQAPDSALSLK